MKVIDAADSSILSNTTNIRLKKKLKGTVSTNPIGYTVPMGNPLYNPHSGHNADSGGIITTTRFKVGGDSVKTYYLSLIHI